ncbi:MAG TPA: aminotransferase class V-fold PLP-dependent enzyme [Vicinamibacterales bacterium]|nr:aminotransferase class V-fold PLP-dependent enzyme [Vicinamibacterales bacterium]
MTPFEEFLAEYPEYQSTAHLDELRAAEYARLDADGHVYLDYTGASLHAASQVRLHADLLNAHALGNPHSASPASTTTTRLVEGARRAVLEWFGAVGEYTAIFTQNATGALKHVAESYPFGPGGRLLLTADNHNSVNGIREFARAAGAAVAYAPLTTPELRLDMEPLETLLADADPRAANLFAFPAQSNFTGVKHPLALVARAHAKGWDVLLDAAAFVPTNRLDLREVQADFVSVSFYKMFGYPTGVGCLLVRNAALGRLRRPWFAGGTVNFSTVTGRRHILSPGEAGFEDGTLNYFSIAAVEIGLRHLAAAGIDAIRTRVDCLTSWLLGRLMQLRHSNGRPMVRIYGPATTKMRGGIVTMNFYDPEGHLLDYRRVEELAGQHQMSLRTGCFCNPGPGETAEGITEDELAAALAAHPNLTLPLFLQMIAHEGGKSAGAIRVSFGIASNFADAQRFVEFAASLRDQTRLTIGEATFDIESCRVIRDGS